MTLHFETTFTLLHTLFCFSFYNFVFWNLTLCFFSSPHLEICILQLFPGIAPFDNFKCWNKLSQSVKLIWQMYFRRITEKEQISWIAHCYNMKIWCQVYKWLKVIPGSTKLTSLSSQSQLIFQREWNLICAPKLNFPRLFQSSLPCRLRIFSKSWIHILHCQTHHNLRICCIEPIIPSHIVNVLDFGISKIEVWYGRVFLIFVKLNIVEREWGECLKFGAFYLMLCNRPDWLASQVQTRTSLKQLPAANILETRPPKNGQKMSNVHNGHSFCKQNHASN